MGRGAGFVCSSLHAMSMALARISEEKAGQGRWVRSKAAK